MALADDLAAAIIDRDAKWAAYGAAKEAVETARVAAIDASDVVESIQQRIKEPVAALVDAQAELADLQARVAKLIEVIKGLGG